MTLHVHGFGHFHPENRITNDFLEELDIGTTDSWIVERVGIRERRTVMPLDYIRATKNVDTRGASEASDLSNADLGARAAEMAIARAGIDKSQVGMLISGSNAPGVLCPAESCVIAQKLELQVPCFDANTACASFVAGVSLLQRMNPESLPDYIVLCAVDALSKVVDFNDRTTAVLFGDGAAAAVISTRVPGRARLLGANAENDPSGAEKIWIERTGHVRQDGRAVQMFAIKRTREGYEKIRDEFATPERDLHMVGHQANLRVLEQVCQRCDIPPERHHANVELRGNTGAASCPSVVSMNWEKWTPRDDVAMVAVGAGLTWTRSLLRFGPEE